MFRLLQAREKELDNSGNVGTILMDLSKAYYCIPHDLVIAKLQAYGLHRISLNIFVIIYIIVNKELKLVVVLALCMTLL